MHLQALKPLALADLAAAALDIEGEAPGRIAAHLGRRGLSEEFADGGEAASIGDRVGARGSANGRLVYLDHLVEGLKAGNPAVAAGLFARTVEGVGQGLLENVVDQGGLARARDARHAHEASQRQAHGEVLEVVAGAALEGEPGLARGHARVGDGHGLAAGKVVGRQRPAALEEPRGRTLVDYLAAEAPGTGPNIDEVVRAADHLLVVLHHHDGVAALLQAVEHIDEALVVARMEADGRLVEDVEHANEAAADLRGQADALHLAAREGRALAVEGEIVEPHIDQKGQALADLLEDFGGHARLVRLQRLAHQVVGPGLGVGEEFVEEAQRFARRQVQQVGQGPAGDRGHAALRAQARAVALGAQLRGEELRERLARVVVVALGVAALKVGQNALEGLLHRVAHALEVVNQRDRLATRAVHQLLAEALGQLAEGGLDVHPARLGEGGDEPVVVHQQVMATAAPAHDGFAQGLGLIRHHERFIKDHQRAEPRTGRAGTVGRVEGEAARPQRLEGDAAVGAGILLGVERALTADNLHLHQPLGEAQRLLDAVGQARADGRLEDQAVDHRIDTVRALLVELRPLAFNLHERAIDPRADVALAQHQLAHLLVAALAPPDDGREQNQLRSLRQCHQAVDNLLGALRADGLAALRAVGVGDVAPEQTQVVEDFGDGGDDGTRVAAAGALLDGDGRGEPFDVLDLGLLQLVEELAGVGREALHVAPLAFGVERIEGQRALARPREAGDDGQRVARDTHIDVLEVILPRAGDDNFAILLVR